MNDRVTIVIPAYNAQKYIRACIKSIRKQTYNDWDAVIVDDGSADQTKEICLRLAEQDQRIHVISQKNQGAPAARRTGIESEVAQRNKWIMFCDADDTIPSDAVEKLLSTAVEYNTDMVCGASRKMIFGIPLKGKNPYCLNLEQPKKIERDEIISDYFCSFFGLSKLPVTVWAKLFRYQNVMNVPYKDDIVHFLGDDLIVTMQVVSELQSMVLIPDIVYLYRMGGGTSKYLPHLLDDFVNLYRFREPFIQKYKMSQDARWYMDVELLYYTQTYLKQYLKHNSGQEIDEEIRKLKSIPEINHAAEEFSDSSNKIAGYAKMLACENAEEIRQYIIALIKADRHKDKLKKIILK